MSVGIVTGVDEVHLKGVPPQIVVKMWRKSVLSEEENAPRELVACWPTAKFHARLEAMRDIFHELCMKRKEHQALPTAWQSSRPDPWKDWDGADTGSVLDEDDTARATPEEPEDVVVGSAVVSGAVSEADDEAMPLPAAAGYWRIPLARGQRAGLCKVALWVWK